MGPTNVALLKLFQADQQLRAAQERLDEAGKNVRLQERRVNDLDQKVKEAQTRLRQHQARAGQLDLDMRTRHRPPALRCRTRGTGSTRRRSSRWWARRSPLR